MTTLPELPVVSRQFQASAGKNHSSLLIFFFSPFKQELGEMHKGHIKKLRDHTMHYPAIGTDES